MLGGLPYGWLPAPVILSSFFGILMAMMLVSIASNKVEGLAVSKLLGIILFGIPLAWFANQYLRIIGCLLPTYWLMDMLIQASKGQIAGYMLDFVLGMACTSVWFAILYGMFMKKLK
jgi:fluoroquinolone transport system permease protein